ncbi:MAG: CvpA family protein [Planctomycetia bacterium]|nr:CvpA family protein [Planctomycetia bacterium]
MAIEGYDLVMLGILAAAAVLGYFKGIVWQLAWIAGIAASSFLALRFSGSLAPLVGQQAPWNRLIAMLAIYVGTSLAVWLVFRVISGAISAVHLSAFDHQLGLVFGLAKGALICVVVTFFAVTLAPAYRNQIVSSRSGRFVAEIIVRADELLPPNIAEPVQPFVKQFEDQFRQPAAGLAAPPPPAGLAQPSAFKAIWESVTSPTAWTGNASAPAALGQGGQQAVPAGFAAPTAWGGPASAPMQPAQPTPPATSGFQNRPQYQQPPGQFPVGAQTPLPIR